MRIVGAGAEAVGDGDSAGGGAGRGIPLAVVVVDARRCRGGRRDRGSEGSGLIGGFAGFGGSVAWWRGVFGGRGRPWR